MKNLKAATVLFFIIGFSLFAGCENAGSAGSDAGRSGDLGDDGVPVPVSALAGITANGLAVLDSVTVEGVTGYLAADANGKKFLIAQGSPRQMGYQRGWLRAADTRRMTIDFPRGVVMSMTGIDMESSKELYDFILSEIMTLCYGALPEIPAGMLAEMEGVAQGAVARGEYVTFDDVLLLNEGFDAIFSILMTGVLPCISGRNGIPGKILQEIKAHPELVDYKNNLLLFKKANPYAIGCNEFVVSGNATVDGKVYHGRDFMFPTSHIYQDVACMSVYLPDEGLPFACVSAPGFVGQTTGINAAGLSMGMDVVMGSCTRSTPGIGCLLVLRDVVQNCSGLDEAVERMKGMDRGVSWLYILADDEYSEKHTNGVVLEEGMSASLDGDEFTGPDTLPLWEQNLLASYIELLDESELPERGVMARNQKWIYPREFRDVGYAVNSPDGERTFGVYFPEQIETWPDAVLATNHYIVPRMVFTSMHPWIALIRDRTDSINRYDELFEIMASEYGAIDFDIARNLIDFLNPGSVYGNLEYYDWGGEIEGHHAIIDNTDLVLEALYGYYGNVVDDHKPWARIDLGAFLSD